jgi:hypothetical protein
MYSVERWRPVERLAVSAPRRMLYALLVVHPCAQILPVNTIAEVVVQM